MVEEKFMLISLDDEKAKFLADVLGNKTCKRIIDHLAVHPEASVKDLSDFLKMPMNTVEYNIKKLVSADLVQKRTNFFWSKKGKKIVMYELSNKSIVIAPKNSNIGSKLKSILPAVFVSIAGAVAVYALDQVRSLSNINPAMNYGEGVVYAAKTSSENVMAAASPEIQRTISDGFITSWNSIPSLSWAWFLGGALLVLFIFSLVNWKKL